MKKVFLAGLAATIVFLVAIMPVGTRDHVTGERGRIIDEVSEFVQDELG